MIATTSASLSAPRARLRDWLIGDALPLWTTVGLDADGRAAEALDFGGRPVPRLARRCRVQARQTFVFCEAVARGWTGDRAPAARALAALIRDYRRDDRLWARTTDDAGAVLDPTPDLYDIAFVLFALAAAHRVLGDQRARPLALETLAAIERDMAHPAGGWVETLPPVPPRRQNPHMHLLEAMLAWREAAPHAAFETVAGQCLDLGRRRFLVDGTIREYLTGDLTPDPRAGHVVEPGHLMEWAWLIGEAGRLGLGEAGDGPIRARLVEIASARGRTTDSWLVREIDAGGGGVLDGARRLWAQTEAARTLDALGDAAAADRLLTAILDTHLATARPGLWMDSYDAAGRGLEDRVPASSLYHLVTMATAVLPDGPA